MGVHRRLRAVADRASARTALLFGLAAGLLVAWIVLALVAGD